MEDAVRPDREAFKTTYEKAYRTWSNIHDLAITDFNLPRNCLEQLETAFPAHPHFPEDIEIDGFFSNTATVRGRAVWKTTSGSCDTPIFHDEVLFQVASDRPTVVEISNSHPLSIFEQWHGEEGNHITVLILAWAYILSARWAEIIPGASGPEYDSCTTAWADNYLPCSNDTLLPLAMVDVGDVDDDAARWWAAVLAPSGGWSAWIRNAKGQLLFSPWSTKLSTSRRVNLQRGTRPCVRQHQAQSGAASYMAALRYLRDYCDHHGVAHQSYEALAAALFLSLAKFDNRRVQLPIPRVCHQRESMEKPAVSPPLFSGNLPQLDKLLTLSCNVIGIKALLSSVFFEPGVLCNISGAWLQGTFAYLDSEAVREPRTLVRVLMKRDPDLGFLWLGAFLTGGHSRTLQEARQGWWKVDLHVAAWTGTHLSFIQEPVPILPTDVEEISRADECRLLYLSHGQSYDVAPLFPFAPFGLTAIGDTNLEVRQHTRCQFPHALAYEGLSWQSREGKWTGFQKPMVPLSLRPKYGQPGDSLVTVMYDNLDFDDDCSEMMTRSIFTWLREEDGFPVAERDIREHEWIENLVDSDDGDCLITGESRSAAISLLQP
ncbi:hypothetical protein BDP55DRAFT_419956 [Colletotrichum godetiae]|uniref:Immunoglobulin variable region used by the itc63b heavy chain n=1 Tax=Colletotrichum godetiae TaxID=1209918 RepID=A0AAJ0AB59_9PEZI|nr:uncharacterized protein BDP55DRAFT_419956 [Colletotrichum godetiae]KAK1657745.1 hypothetical protein BDP55DRAFT_419956 [Colletotrichum godetiae]